MQVMRGELLPLFPLQTVLLPRAPLPLHIFEERYKEMITEVLERDGEFGVVLGRDGSIVNIGCTARVARVLQQHEDGRLDVLCVGVQRFRVLDLDESRSFLRAHVEQFGDEALLPASAERTRAAIAAWRRFAEAAGEEAVEFDEDEGELSFVLGALSPDLEFRQTLLGARSESRRIELVAQHFAERLERAQREALMRRTASTNGHAKH
jgi:Lon protease-like protein